MLANNLSRAELIELVRRIAESEGTEHEIDEMIAELARNVADPEISNYIFWPDRPMTPEQIVDRALAYEPIRLPAPDDERP